MKKTRLIDLFTNIKISKVSFISITIFVALSISIFLGFSWLMDGIDETVDTYESDEKYNLHDLEISFPYGFSDDDVEAVEALEDVEQAEGRRIIYDYFTLGLDNYQAKIIEITEGVDKLELNEGRLPVLSGEVAVESVFAEKHSLEIGDTIRLEGTDGGSIPISKIMSFDSATDDVEEFFSDDDSSDSTESNGYLKTDVFTITGLVVSPEYACDASLIYGFSPSNSLNIDTAFFMDESSFDDDAFLGYTDMIISGAESDRLNRDDGDYDEYVSELETEVADLIDPVTSAKKEFVLQKENEVMDAIDAKLSEAKSEIVSASTQIADNQIEIDQGQKEISEAKYQTDKAKKQLEDAKSQLEEYKTQLEEGKEQLAKAGAQIEDGQKQLEEGKEEFSSKAQEWLEGYNTLEDAKKQLNEGIEEYNYNKCVYDGAMRDFSIAKSILEYGKTIIADMRSGSVTADNYEEYLNKWDLYEKIDTLKNFQEKYAGEYDLSLGTGDKLDTIKKDLAEYCVNPCESTFNALFDSLYELYEISADSIIEQCEKKLKEAQDELNLALDEIHAAQEQINHAQAQVDYGKMQLDDAQKEIEEKEQELSDAQEEYSEGLSEYNEKNSQYEAALGEFNDSTSEIESGISEISDNQDKLNEGVEELAAAREKLQESINEFEEKKSIASEQMDSIETMSISNAYSILTRTSVLYLNSETILNNIIGMLKYTLAGLFVLIGILVCYSAVVRMVYLQTTIIGTKKALGFTEGEITRFYLYYIGIAGVIGCIAGILLGVVFERILMLSYSSYFRFDRYYHVYSPDILLCGCGVQLAILLLITFFASRKMLAREAIELLSGTDDNSGKTRFYQKTRLFKRLSFLGKIIVNNTFSDGRRVFGTIVGVLGSTALIVTSLTFYLNISTSIKRQFTDFYHFNHIISFDSSVSEDAEENILNVLNEYSCDTSVIRRMFVFISQPNGLKGGAFMYVPEDTTDFSNLVDFDIGKSNGSSNPYEGLWMTYSYWNYFKNEANDELDLISVSGNSATAPITGYYDHFLTYFEIFASKDYYEEYLNEDYEPNAILADISDDDLEKITSELHDVEGFVKDDNYYETSCDSYEFLTNFAAAVMVLYLSLAIVMSILVLLNLLNQFVDEKKRELIVMLINGFEYRDAKRYIYADTIVLAIFGIILGTVLGTLTGILTIKGFDSAMLCLMQKISVWSCVLGIAGAALLTLAMTLTALKKIDRFELTDINRY